MEDYNIRNRVYHSFQRGFAKQAELEANKPTNLSFLNQILAVSPFQFQLILQENGRFVVDHYVSGNRFSINKLSDGERAAILLVGQILNSHPQVIIIDEPERHLHRSIIFPIIAALAKRRKDCGFIIATHDIELPSRYPDSTTLIMRMCEWEGDRTVRWGIDVLENDNEIPDDIRKAILGGRRKMLFIEETYDSLDFRLYSRLFPYLSIVPCKSCRAVCQVVEGLNASNQDLHWLKPLGLIDRDNRSEVEVEALNKKIFSRFQ